MSEGKVKWFNAVKGYGFIESEPQEQSVESEAGGDVFVHHSVIQMDGYRTLKQGERVTFEVSQGPKGLQAVSVMPVR
jgi:CspA family cold shock protein